MNAEINELNILDKLYIKTEPRAIMEYLNVFSIILVISKQIIGCILLADQQQHI